MLYRVAILVTVLTFSARAQLVRDWRVVRTAHFELVSRYDQKQAATLLADMEWLRAVFEKNHGAKYKQSRRALVLVPDSPHDFEKIAPSGAAGYYLGLPSRDLIVLKEMFGARHASLHEFTHLTLHSESHLWPRWFNEGTAEFYGSARKMGKWVEAGSPISRIAVLEKGAWIPLDVMFLRNPEREFTSPEMVQKFYAQSWLYVNMLHSQPAYREGFPRFRARMAEGADTASALREVYGKTTAQFDYDARSWRLQRRYPVEQLEPAEPQTGEPEVRVMDNVEVDIVIATVAAHSGRTPDAARQYAAFSRLPGGGCERKAALGDLAFAAGLFGAAVSAYNDATGCGVDPPAILSSVEFSMRQGRDTMLERATLEPLYKLRGAERLHYLTGSSHYFAGRYAEALAEFDQASNLTDSDKFRIARMRVVALGELRRFDEARAAAREVAALAQDEYDRRSAELALEDVDRAEKSAASADEPFSQKLLRSLSRIDGHVVNVECTGANPRFHIKDAAGATHKLVIDDPGQVVTGETAVQLEFGCGPQRRAATVGFLPQPHAATGTAGRIRYLQFR